MGERGCNELAMIIDHGGIVTTMGAGQVVVRLCSLVQTNACSDVRVEAAAECEALIGRGLLSFHQRVADQSGQQHSLRYLMIHYVAVVRCSFRLQVSRHHVTADQWINGSMDPRPPSSTTLS